MSGINKLPEVGSKWQHRNGNRYEVVMLTNTESSRAAYPVTVVYKNRDTGSLWSRPAYDWHRSMSKDN